VHRGLVVAGGVGAVGDRLFDLLDELQIRGNGRPTV
jgi:hypothetical protein